LNICGSSLILVLRRNFPMGNKRGSFRRVMDPVPIFGLFFNIVANLRISKGTSGNPGRLE
jgi:hypothetical protein